MPAVQYPFIDIAVHARVRERFSRGEAMVLFSADLARLLWANGAGAELFGHSAVYDLLDQGSTAPTSPSASWKPRRASSPISATAAA